MEVREKIRCDICNKEISKSNWNKHIKTKKHLEKTRIEKYCLICNTIISENEWISHIKSKFHKKNRKLFKKKLKKSKT
jgi:hypothetical protein